ncbi:MAG TPA: vWA domain-containing protein [Anaeromyxobacter sp.]|nr:vWA domain-containing protein [Anaeromyxobacter sp.]
MQEGPGAAVAILVDVSGSMQESWGGAMKSEAARRALSEALEATGEFRKRHPDRPVKVGVIAFSDEVQQVMPMGDYDPERVEQALGAIPYTSGRTAIGAALDAAREALYRSGAIRKYILVITDGENNRGPDPEDVAREIAQRSNGAVSISLVAVDVDPGAFGFVRELGGDVLSPQDPAALRAAVQQIYEGKILAEAADEAAEAPAPAGEALPEAPTPTKATGSSK